MKTILSGIQPSGKITLGNYLGAINNFVKLQNSVEEDTNIFLFIADLHAITVHQEPSKLRDAIKSLAAIYLACGIDRNKSSIFVQSEVQEHAEIGYLLQTITYIGELERMTQYKDKMVKQQNGVSSALLTYPVLMAGDILLYNTNYVPVGSDQKQHLELARTLANRFNNLYSDTFNIPEPIIQKIGARIMSLQDPLVKMSKSDKLEKAVIYLLDDSKTIRKKIMSAVTDSENIIKYDCENKPGISNLIVIASCCSDLSIEEVEKHCANMNYGEFKEYVSNCVIEKLAPVQERYYQILNSKELDDILNEGRDKAKYYANKTLLKMKRKMGILRK